MRFYNFETVLLDERVFVPAELEARDIFGNPILPDDARSLQLSKTLCPLQEPMVPGIAA